MLDAKDRDELCARIINGMTADGSMSLSVLISALIHEAHREIECVSSEQVVRNQGKIAGFRTLGELIKLSLTE
jgi:hypothetical protein